MRRLGVALSVFVLAVGFAWPAAAETDAAGIITLPAGMMGFGEDRGLSIEYPARRELTPLVQSLRGNPNDRLLIAFQATPRNLEAATALYTYLAAIGIPRSRMQMGTRDDGTLNLREGVLKLVRVPEGVPMPNL